jgi:hypothetical protein
MTRPGPVIQIIGILAAALAIAGCNGQVIRLGGSVDSGTSCPHAQVPANEVLWIGDSWVLVPNGEPHTDVRDLARAAGAIGPTDDYTIGAVAATTMTQIAAQYSAQESTGTMPKVLIMDGGTWDTITNGTAAATINGVASAFTQLLSTVANDGTVTAVIYFLVPELSNIPGVSTLHPLLQQACTASTVPCYFIDLQPIWSGHSEYSTTTAPPVPTSAGATAMADAIWAAMQAHCVAQ